MTSSGSFVFGLRAFDCVVRFDCPNSEIRDELNRYIFPPLQRSESELALPGIDVRLAQDEQGISVLLNEKLVASGATIRGVMVATIKAVDDAVVHCLKSFRAVHAGAVLIGDTAVLLPGSTHAGKSSLVAELLRRGASYFSDEYALIDIAGCVHPYPRPLLLRDGRSQQSAIFPEELNARFATGPTRLGWIFATRYVPGEEWSAHEMTQSEAVTLLLRNTPHEMAQAPQLLDMFIRAVSGANCFSGKRGDAAGAAERILQLVAASPSRG